MSYYGYVAPDINKEVNWAKIGTDFADMLYKGEEDREKKRKEIDAETDKVIKLINESPTGLSKSLSDWSLDFGSKAKNQMLMLNRELKAGRLNPDKFIKYRQNLNDGTKGIYETMDRFKKYGAEVEEKIRKGVASEAERWAWATVEKLGRFSESEAYINPTDSNVYIAPLKDGKIDTDPNNIMSPAALNRMLETKYDGFDILGSSKKIADAAAKDIRVVNKGGIKTISNILQRPGFDEKDPSKLDPTTKLYLQLENDAVNAALYTDEVSMSVLVDGRQVNKRTGNVYDFTTDEKDPGIKTGDKIYMKFNPGTSKYDPMLTEEQKEDARNVLKASIRYQLPYEETPMAERQVTGRTPTEGDYERAAKSKKDRSAVNEIAKIWYGNTTELQEGLDYFKGLIPNAINIEKTSDGNLSITYKDGTVSPIQIKGKSIEGFIRSATELTGIEDVNEALRSAQYDKKAPYSSATGKSVRSIASSGEAQGTLVDAWGAKVKEMIPSIPKNEDEALSSLSNLTGFGFKVRVPYTYGDYIAIKGPKGEQEFSTSDTDAIYNFIIESLDETELQKLAKKGSIKLSPSTFNP